MRGQICLIVLCAVAAARAEGFTERFDASALDSGWTKHVSAGGSIEVHPTSPAADVVQMLKGSARVVGNWRRSARINSVL